MSRLVCSNHRTTDSYREFPRGTAAQVDGLASSGDSGPDYLGTGLADALITRLSAIRRFAVRPTSSVLRYGTESDRLSQVANSVPLSYSTAGSGVPRIVYGSLCNCSMSADGTSVGPDNLMKSLLMS